jgi:hypothetical protein
MADEERLPADQVPQRSFRGARVRDPAASRRKAKKEGKTRLLASRQKPGGDGRQAAEVTGTFGPSAH